MSLKAELKRYELNQSTSTRSLVPGKGPEGGGGNGWGALIQKGG